MQAVSVCRLAVLPVYFVLLVKDANFQLPMFAGTPALLLSLWTSS